MARDEKFEELDPKVIIEEMREQYWRGISDPEEEEVGDAEQVLVVELGSELFAMDAEACKSITKFGRITRVPRMPSYMLGVINLRGQIVSVIDLGGLLSVSTQENSPKARLVVAESRGVRVSFLVDRVIGIEWVPVSRIRDPQSTASSLKDEFLRGHIAPEDELGNWVTFLDVEKVMHGEELSFSR